MKKFILLIVLSMMIILPAFAGEDNSKLKEAVKLYKAGNYTRSMQLFKDITSNDPGNALAYYYLGMCYVQIGDKESAINSYKTVITLSPDSQLATNSRVGLNNINPPDMQENTPAVDPVQGFLSEQAKEAIQKSKLNTIIENTNSNKEINPSLYKGLDNFDPDKPKKKDKDYYLNEKPSQEKIVEAMQTLSQAGINPYGNMQNPQINPEMMQMNMLMGAFGGGNNMGNMNGNNMNNMLPLLMMMQNNQGSNNISPEAIQTMMSSMMMPEMMNLYGNNNNN